MRQIPASTAWIALLKCVFYKLKGAQFIIEKEPVFVLPRWQPQSEKPKHESFGTFTL